MYPDKKLTETIRHSMQGCLRKSVNGEDFFYLGEAIVAVDKDDKRLLDFFDPSVVYSPGYNLSRRKTTSLTKKEISQGYISVSYPSRSGFRVYPKESAEVYSFRLRYFCKFPFATISAYVKPEDFVMAGHCTYDGTEGVGYVDFQCKYTIFVVRGFYLIPGAYKNVVNLTRPCRITKI